MLWDSGGPEPESWKSSLNHPDQVGDWRTLWFTDLETKQYCSSEALRTLKKSHGLWSENLNLRISTQDVKNGCRICSWSKYTVKWSPIADLITYILLGWIIQQFFIGSVTLQSSMEVNLNITSFFFQWHHVLLCSTGYTYLVDLEW